MAAQLSWHKLCSLQLPQPVIAVPKGERFLEDMNLQLINPDRAVQTLLENHIPCKRASHSQKKKHVWS